MTEWLAGNRIRGTKHERLNTSGIAKVSGSWKEVGRTTLGTAGTNISVLNIPNRQYYMILTNIFPSAQTEGDCFRLNDDSTGNHFAGNITLNGSTMSPFTSKNKIGWYGFHPHTLPAFSVGYMSSNYGKQKLIMNTSVGMSSNTTGAASDAACPDRSKMVGKYVPSDLGDSITQVNIVNTWNNYQVGSEVVVLGWDESNTSTVNFWEELTPVGGVTATGSVAYLDSGSFAAKKYLWVQIYVHATGGAITPQIEFNGSGGSAYIDRNHTDATEYPTPNKSQSSAYLSHGASDPTFINLFIINNKTQEKLGTSESVSGASGVVPTKSKYVLKWANTTEEITSIKIKTDATQHNFSTTSMIKVWGSN